MGSAGQDQNGPPSGGSFGVFKERDAGGEAVQAVAASDRTDLPLRKEAGSRNRSDGVLQAAGIVAGLGEQPCAPAIAAEDEGAHGRCAAVLLPGQKERQIVVRALRVTDMELDRLARADQISHRDHAGVRVGAYDVPHQKVAALEVILVFTGDAADME